MNIAFQRIIPALNQQKWYDGDGFAVFKINGVQHAIDLEFVREHKSMEDFDVENDEYAARKFADLIGSDTNFLERIGDTSTLVRFNEDRSVSFEPFDFTQF